ncbi:ligand-binding sensor domain-containing protein [Paludisphaera soli]|uniref:ligand-binding sensor domain-containing protein n=1 Tax=Paludisphaera soli TaxID=2712865 RepID=UPI0013EA4266|nr:two-component regulator propeller domain-containing protein [Paludisphaera soli]
MSSQKPNRLPRVALALSLVALAEIAPRRSEGGERGPAVARGETVAELGKRIWVVFRAGNGDLWFGSDGQGAYRFDGKTLVRFTTKDGLSGDRVREFQEDGSGNLFIGTLDGVSKFDGKDFVTLAPVEHEGLEGWRLNPDDLWFKGDSTSPGPYRYDGTTLHHLKFPRSEREDEHRRNNPDPPASPYGVYTIYQDSLGRLWFGTAALGLCRYDGESFGWMYERELTDTPGGGSFGIRSIMEDKHGRFWICNTAQRYTISPEPGAVRYTKERGVDLPKIPGGEDPAYFNGVTRDRDRNLWMSTFGGGVWRYDGAKLTNYPAKDGGKDALGVSIYADGRGDVWLGTLESGAYRLDGETFKAFRP